MPLPRFGIGPLSLRWHIAGWATLVVLTCLAIAFAAVYRGTGSQLRGQIDRQLSSDARQLSRALTDAPGRSSKELAVTADRYIAGRPFSATSTLLFVKLPDQPTNTNRPELFRRRPPDNGETRAEQLAENRLSAALLNAPAGYTTLPLPDVGNLRLLTRPVAIAGGSIRVGHVLVGVGQPLAAVADAQRGVSRAFILAGLLAIAGALLGGILLGTHTSRPLRRIATIASRVDAGDLHPRIHIEGRAGVEIEVLAGAFNRMLDRLADAFASQREFIADASHELRTPLTVMRGQLEVLAEDSEPSSAEVRRVEAMLQAEVARVDRLVEDLLLLAELEHTELLQKQDIQLGSFIAQLWQSTTLIAQRDFRLDSRAEGTLHADPDRIAQALRNLLTNAVKHTREPDGTVTLRSEPGHAGRIWFTIDDDGPGIPRPERTRVFDRFHRIDPARDRASGGTGLGLAIVAAIAQAHGGSVSAERSPSGGARIVLELAGYTAVEERLGDAVGPEHSPTNTDETPQPRHGRRRPGR